MNGAQAQPEAAGMNTLRVLLPFILFYAQRTEQHGLGKPGNRHPRTFRQQSRQELGNTGIVFHMLTGIMGQRLLQHKIYPVL
ncbi:hypothetical protein D3C80_1996800 [compost metagenome]